jgi:acyl-CoA reductase-like NAD-dependent aldehyde dehydrogenase
MEVTDKIYINGAWVPSAGTGTLEVFDATSEAVLATIPEGVSEDVDAAVAAAKAAFPSWSALSPAARCELLVKAGDALAARSDEIAELIARQVGTPLKIAQRIQSGLGLGVFAGLPKALDGIEWEEEIGNSLVVKEPVGVVGAITPWNYPFFQAALKVVHALVAGCTVVLKPSEVAPLDAFVMAEVFDEVGLPAGVFNLVMGTGPVVGEAIASHPDVDAVTFTGSTRAGTRVMQVGAETIKHVSLELGGKSANVILEDADFSRAVPAGVFSAFFNGGQTCTAPTRMVVPRSKLAEVEELAVSAASSYTVGDPFSEDTKLGPMASAAQRDRVRGYITTGIDEGATLLTGGPEAPEGLDKGFFIRPTVFSNVDPKSTIAQEEIFGPVLSIIAVDSEEEALEVANDSIYGLAGSVWAADDEHALEFARQMRTGQVDVNGGAFNPEAPFGGYKRSGIGKERGRYGIEEFLSIKSLQR